NHSGGRMIDQPQEPVEAEANNEQKPGGGPGQSKLVIPAYFDEQQQDVNVSQTLRVKPRQITQTQRPTPQSPTRPLTDSSPRLPSLWSKDPARKVLIIAAIALILSGIL